MNFVDSGFELESHGDHFDLHIEDPALLDYAISGDRPAHVTQADEQIVLFFDGNAAAPAQVHVLDEHDIEDNHEAATLEYSTNQHGAAQVHGGYLLATLRPADSDSTLPDRVALFQRDDSSYTAMFEFETPCPGLNGSAQNADVIAFGCEDGVLVIEDDADNAEAPFSSRKIAFGQRISSLYASQELNDMVGIGGASGSRSLFRVQIASDAVSEITWTEDNSLQPLRLAFADEGEHLIVLDHKGGLTLLHTEHWVVEQERLQLSSVEATEGFEMTLDHDRHTAFITDRTSGELITVDLEEWTVSERIALDFIPHKIVWLGVPSDSHEAH